MLINTVLMALAAIIFVGFWAYLAWDSRDQVVRVKARKKPEDSHHHR